MKAIIEIPKGDDRRRHLKYDRSGFIDLGPTKDVIPVNNGIMPIHYGFIPKTTSNTKEGDEIDIMVLSNKKFEVGQEIEVESIALINREDNDDKVVAVDETMKAIKKWDDIPKDERELITSFFSYHHKFRSIESAEIAMKYVEDGYKQFLQASKEI
ncbi:MAG: inorganic diphosphatase [Patescibacteria group bacterium]